MDDVTSNQVAWEKVIDGYHVARCFLKVASRLGLFNRELLISSLSKLADIKAEELRQMNKKN